MGIQNGKNKKYKDLTGQKFGRLTAIEYAGKDKKRNALWKCKCDCGNEKIVQGYSLTVGKTQSCGCYMRECVSLTMHKHGHSGEKLYQVWYGMMARCYKPNRKEYHNYGGRGIKVCNEWHDYNIFKSWAIPSGFDENAARGVCTLDRIDVNGDYEPNNCRWISLQEQHRNRRDSINITILGETANLKDFSRKYGISYSTLRMRYHKHGANPIILLDAERYKARIREKSHE